MIINTIGKVTFNRRIADMEPGETAWVTPWSLRYAPTGVVIDISMDATLFDGDFEPIGMAKITYDGDGEWTVDVTGVTMGF